MADTPTQIRSTVRRRLLDLIRARPLPALTVVRYTDTRADTPIDTIFAGKCTGAMRPQGSRNAQARIGRDDSWTQELWFCSIRDGDDDGVKADDGASLLFAALEHVLATNPTLALNNAPPLGFNFAYLTGVDGPSPYYTEFGMGSEIRAEVVCSARLR